MRDPLSCTSVIRSLLLLIPALAGLCRYTVRDVAFVDLGDESYRLELRAPAPEAETLGVIASSLLDTNVTYEVDELEAFSSERSKVTLHHPDGREMEVDIWGEDSLDAVKLNDIASSPLRERMLDEVFARYAFCLLVEGEDPEKNARAREVIDGAFTELGKIFAQMPKAVGDRPRLTTLAHDRRADERYLLFGLGIEEASKEPAFAVIMGRGRRVGPVLIDEEISPTAVFGILNAIGQSCECDLDRSWMQGPRIPLRWDAAAKERVVQDLSFDAESPFIKTEISGILARGPQHTKGEAGVSLEEALLAYEEIVIPTRELEEEPSAQPTAAPAPAEDEGEEPASKKPWLAIAVALITPVIVSTLFLLQSRRRGQRA